MGGVGDAKFVVGLASGYGDLDAFARVRLKRLVYLARYLRQSLDSLARLPLDELATLFDLTCEIVREENATADPLTNQRER